MICYWCGAEFEQLYDRQVCCLTCMLKPGHRECVRCRVSKPALKCFNLNKSRCDPCQKKRERERLARRIKKQSVANIIRKGGHFPSGGMGDTDIKTAEASELETALPTPPSCGGDVCLGRAGDGSAGTCEGDEEGKRENTEGEERKREKGKGEEVEEDGESPLLVDLTRVSAGEGEAASPPREKPNDEETHVRFAESPRSPSPEWLRKKPTDFVSEGRPSIPTFTLGGKRKMRQQRIVNYLSNEEEEEGGEESDSGKPFAKPSERSGARSRKRSYQDGEADEEDGDEEDTDELEGEEEEDFSHVFRKRRRRRVQQESPLPLKKRKSVRSLMYGRKELDSVLKKNPKKKPEGKKARKVSNKDQLAVRKAEENLLWAILEYGKLERTGKKGPFLSLNILPFKA